MTSSWTEDRTALVGAWHPRCSMDNPSEGSILVLVIHQLYLLLSSCSYCPDLPLPRRSQCAGAPAIHNLSQITPLLAALSYCVPLTVGEGAMWPEDTEPCMSLEPFLWFASLCQPVAQACGCGPCNQ